jgi:hypothetical protein
MFSSGMNLQILLSLKSMLYSLDAIIDCFTKVRAEHSIECAEFGLSAFAVQWSAPLFKAMLTGWALRQEVEQHHRFCTAVNAFVDDSFSPIFTIIDVVWFLFDFF